MNIIDIKKWKKMDKLSKVTSIICRLTLLGIFIALAVYSTQVINDEGNKMPWWFTVGTIFWGIILALGEEPEVKE
jgi:RsiW-degrading membrane proteinase PrsW (M82 family)